MRKVQMPEGWENIKELLKDENRYRNRHPEYTPYIPLIKIKIALDLLKEMAAALEACDELHDTEWSSNIMASKVLEKFREWK